MTNQKRVLPACLIIGEVRYPVVRQRNFENDKRMYVKFNLEVNNSSGVTTHNVVIDEGFLNRESGEFTPYKVFDKAKQLKHGSKVIINCNYSVVIKDDKLYLNDSIFDIYPLTDRIDKELASVGFNLN